MHVRLLRLALGPPGPPGLLELAHLLLLLRIHADHRVPGGQELLSLGADVAELGVPVRVLGALQGLHVRLQAEPLILQQPRHRRRRYLVPRRGELICEGAHRFGGPLQRGLGVTARVRLHQCPQRPREAGVAVIRALAPRARPPRTARRLIAVLQLKHPAGHRRAGQPGGAGDQAHPAMAALPRLGAHPQPTLPLIQERRQQLPLARDLGLAVSGGDHSTNVGTHNRTVAVDF